MDIKAQLMQALMSGQDPAEALRLSLLKNIDTEGASKKLDQMINTLTRLINYKLMSDSTIPYTDIDHMLKDFDDITDIYSLYPQLKSSLQSLISIIETRDKIKID